MRLVHRQTRRGALYVNSSIRIIPQYCTGVVKQQITDRSASPAIAASRSAVSGPVASTPLECLFRCTPFALRSRAERRVRGLRCAQFFVDRICHVLIDAKTKSPLMYIGETGMEWGVGCSRMRIACGRWGLQGLRAHTTRAHDGLFSRGRGSRCT